MSDREILYRRVTFQTLGAQMHDHLAKAEEHRQKAAEHRAAEEENREEASLIEDIMLDMVDEHPWLADAARHDAEREMDRDETTQALLAQVERAVNQPAAVVAVATLMGPDVHVRKVAELLYRSGRWKASPETLRTTTTKILAKHPNFLALGNGRYKQVLTGQSN